MRGLRVTGLSHTIPQCHCHFLAWYVQHERALQLVVVPERLF